MEDIISEAKKSAFRGFKKFIRKYFLDKYKIDLNEANGEDYNLKERLDIINHLLKQKINNLNNPQLDLKEITYIAKINSEKNNEIENVNQNLIVKIQEKIKKELDFFLNFEFEGRISGDLTELKEKEKSLSNNKLLKDKNFIDIINKDAVNLFPKNIDNKYKKSKEIINIINDFNEFYKEKSIRILFIGIISSGKTSLLNSIIGYNYNILERKMTESTRCIYRIKYSSKISFCESTIIKTSFGSYFKDIATTRIFDIDTIKNKISYLNKEGKYGYYTLYIPIEALENIENKEKIELIDLPGIKKDNADVKINLKELIDISDGFIFNFNSLNIADENTQFILTKIIKNIKERTDFFDFENCLFNLNWIDEIQSDLLENKIEEFKKTIKKSLNIKIYTGNFFYKISMKKKLLSSKDINISYFSNLYYQNYLESTNDIESLNFIKNGKSWEKIYQDLLDEYDEIEKYISNISDYKYKKEINDIISNICKIKKLPKDEINLKKIAKFIFYFKNNKKHLIKQYEASKAEIFFEKFKKQINSSILNNKNNIFNKFNKYLFDLFLHLFFINEFCSEKGKINENKRDIEIKKKIIENEFRQIVQNINYKFLNKEKIIDEYKENAINTLISDEEEKLTKEQIYQRIKSSDIEVKINSLMEHLDDEIKKIQIDFYFFIIKEIADLLKDLDSFQNILENVSSSYNTETGNGIFIYSSITGGVFLASSFGASIATTSLGLTVGILGIVYSVVGLLTALPVVGIIIYERNKSNKEKIGDYFEEIKKNMNKIKKEYIKRIEEKKNYFISKLENTNNISEKEIEFLKNNDFKEKFEKFLSKLKS